MRRLTFWALVFHLFLSNAYGQAPFDVVQKPAIVSTPVVQNGVNMFTGRLSLSIPFYQYKSTKGNISLNVSLTYEGGGVKRDDQFSNAGTGWGLFAGGSINRIVNGLPDDIRTPGTPADNYVKKGYAYTYGIDEDPCPSQYINVGAYVDKYRDNKINRDSEADYFQFSFGNKQGTFVIPKNSLLTGGTTPIVTIPQSNLEITPLMNTMPSNVNTGISGFVIKDNDGVTYRFEAIEKVKKKNCTAQDIGGGAFSMDCTEVDEYYVVGWKLTKIEDSNSPDVIMFNYESFNATTKTDVSTEFYRLPAGNLEHRVGDFTSNPLQLQRLKTIILPNNDVVTLQYKPTDITGFIAGEQLLSRVEISNGTALPVHYLLNHIYRPSYVMDVQTPPYPGTPLYWAVLQSIERVIGSNRMLVSSFEYLSLRETQLGKSLTRYYAPFLNEVSNFGREYSRSRPQVGSLYKITNAYGGYTQYEFENNTGYTPLNNAIRILDGIRISKVIESDGINEQSNVITQYKYELDNGTSSGFGPDDPPTEYNNELDYGQEVKAYRVYSYVPVLRYQRIHGSPVCYSRVEESKGNGKVVYEYSSFQDAPPLDATFQYPFANKQRIAEWAYGNLKNQTIYNTENVKVKSLVHEYNTVFYTYNSANYRSMKGSYQRDLAILGMASCEAAKTIYLYKHEIYYPVTGRVELNKSIETDYIAGNDPIIKIKELYYDPVTYNLTRTVAYNSINEKFESHLFYSYDFPISSNIYKLKQKNITNLPVLNISTLTKSDNTRYIVGYNRAEYQVLTQSYVKPLQILTLRSVLPIPITTAGNLTFDSYAQQIEPMLESDILFEKYDATGNVIQEKNLRLNVQTSTSWGPANQKFPIAKVVNAANNEFYYEGFEFATNAATTTPFAGKKYIFGDFAVPFAMPNNRKYFIDYRYLDNGSWKYIQKIYSNNMLLTEGSAIDEIRVYPIDAQITTYTTDPFNGIVSLCQQGKFATFNEYDHFNRKIRERDENRNIMKQYQYSLKVPPRFFNVAKSINKQPNNCLAGQVASTVQYVVLAGTYSSIISQADADQQAINDINVNSQGYANANGICEWYSAEKSVSFTRNNCTTGYEGSVVQYVIPYGKYKSQISQSDADQQAQTEVDTNGQTYANNNGNCTLMCVAPCTGIGKKCINGVCETGTRVNTGSAQVGTNLWICYYHYVFSDGSKSPTYSITGGRRCI